jgi:RNA polymerase sigma-70 factor (ECF subfamily)
VNVVLMHRRAARRRPRLVDEEQADPAVDGAPSAEDALDSRLRMQAFYRLIERLSDKKRVVFMLHELEGLSPARISEIVQAPVLTVRTRLFYARRELAQLLSEEPELESIAAELGGARAAAERLSKEVQ